MSWEPITADAFRERVLRRFERRDALLAEGSGDHVLNPGLDMGYLPPRDAAVLMPVIDRPGGAGVLLTTRTNHLPSHKGQIAFPGGKIDPDDASPEAAALREAQEEVGLDPARVEVLGRFANYVSRTGFNVAPVVGIVPADAPITVNPGEVADAFEVPLGFLMSDAMHEKRSMVWQERERFFWAMPWRDEAVQPPVERAIWGLTAGVIRMIWERLYR